MRRRALSFLILAFPATLAAQAPASAPTRDGVMHVFDNFVVVMGNRLVAAFDSIPAGQYGFRPKPAQQTIGFIAQHLEGANYALCSRFGGIERPIAAKDSLADTVKARWPKDTLVARLRSSLSFCHTALARVQKLETQGQARTILAFETDLAEHYSQLAVYMRLLDLVPPSALPARTRTAVELPASALAPFTGVYRVDETQQLDITMRDGALFIHSTGGATRRLLAESSTDFFLKVPDAQITFTRNASGRVTGLVVHQDELDTPAEKIR